MTIESFDYSIKGSLPLTISTPQKISLCIYLYRI